MPRFDQVDRQLLELLQDDGRMSFTDLAKRVGLSSPAAAERVRRLEEQGVITGYKARVDASKLGYPLRALVRIGPVGGPVPDLEEFVAKRPEIVACHNITGAECFLIEVIADTMATLKDLIEELRAFGTTITNVVLETLVDHRVIVPPEEG